MEDRCVLSKILTESEFTWNPDIKREERILEVDFEVEGKPSRTAERPLSPKLIKIVEEKLKEILENNIITPRKNPKWISRIHMVLKDNKEWRMTIDYRKLNDLIVTKPYAIPHIHDLLKSFANKSWFSKIDLKDGFWNVGLKESCRTYTTFHIPCKGTFMFNVLPF